MPNCWRVAGIRQNYSRVRSLEQAIEHQRLQLVKELSVEHMEIVKKYGRVAESREEERTRKRQKRKFEKLNHRSRECGNSRFNRLNLRCRKVSTDANFEKGRWVINMSSSALTEQQESVLSKGLNFAVVPRSIPIPRSVCSGGFIKNMECAWY